MSVSFLMSDVASSGVLNPEGPLERIVAPDTNR